MLSILLFIFEIETETPYLFTMAPGGVLFSKSLLSGIPSLSESNSTPLLSTITYC